MKKIFVSFTASKCSVYREYNTDEELYNLVKDCTGIAVYFFAIEDKRVVYEYKRGISPDRINLKTFVKKDIRGVNEKDVKRVRYAFSRRLINCSPERFNHMMVEAEKEGVI